MTAASRILRYARQHAGLSQRELARVAGVPQPAIARIEAGKVSPRLDTLQRLLAAAGADLEPMPRLGLGIDRPLIQEHLARTPEQRIRLAGADARNLAAFVAAVKHGRR